MKKVQNECSKENFAYFYEGGADLFGKKRITILIKNYIRRYVDFTSTHLSKWKLNFF